MNMTSECTWEKGLMDNSSHRTPRTIQGAASRINFDLESSNKSIESNVSSLISAPKTTKVKCKVHGRSHVMVETCKFTLICSKCSEQGFSIENLEPVNESDSEDEIDIEDGIAYTCDKHSSQSGSFYCDDCKEFLCKNCFANEHRVHNSNIPSVIVEDFKLLIREKIIRDILILQPKLEENSVILAEISNKIKTLKESCFDRTKTIVGKITSAAKSRKEVQQAQFEEVFGGMDLEIDSLEKRLRNLIINLNESIRELSEISSMITTKNLKSTEICIYHKRRKKLLLEFIQMSEDTKNIINFKIGSMTSKVKAKLNHITTTIDKLSRLVSMYEKSVQSSISTGISSSCLRVRRYIDFNPAGCKYFKTTSVICKVNTPICIIGFGICGLYLNQESKSLTLLNKSVKISNTQQETLIKENKCIQLQVCVAEIKNEEEKKTEVLINEVQYLTGIINSNDPTLLIYFNKATILKPEKKYLLSCTNQNSNMYVEIWCGEVHKSCLTAMTQTIHCNTSGINFEFSAAMGHESDFDEFRHGIVADLLFSLLG